MLRIVRGTVAMRLKDALVVDTGGASGGIGFKIAVPEPTAARFQDGAAVFLHTYLQVREDALSLFGFETEEELAIFELLLTVSGVGPKVALSTLSTLSPDALRLALANNEPAMIARVPGVGKRTAEKIVVELKDKIKAPATGIEALANINAADAEVIDALIALGYSVVESQRAVQALPKDVTQVEERLRLALRNFSA
ncbi:MAG: Holliday junction branch migration protein RuvA [Caldilinea sp.]|nr:Holliday junction branch migration protein RuvA [Caldilinea sp.]MCB0149958.1 Holliday junction branch migration protein RuvA [Caldilineaceae bacterium]MCB9114267.1 Holliday junction branch migration protein RuvA [Caldilineaceae bacterium]MCB9120893.1 Holliday junction branch migration protein RuvA [Caldilineaceae bacterium]MCO5209832.1 Holliday junction branch migration protein RuvA [Caldilinea sp.]